MNAWQRLLTASSLAIGTAWDLITHPKTGGSGATVYIEQIQSTVDDATTSAELLDDTIQASVADDTITSAVTVTDTQGTLTDSTITVETS